MLEVRLPTPAVMDVKAILKEHGLSESLFLQNYTATTSHIISSISHEGFVCRNMHMEDSGVYTTIDIRRLPTFNAVMNYCNEDTDVAEELLSRIASGYEAGMKYCPVAKLSDLYESTTTWPKGWVVIYMDFILCLGSSSLPKIKTLQELRAEFPKEVERYARSKAVKVEIFDDNAARDLAASGVPFERVYKIVDHARGLTQDLHRQNPDMSSEEYHQKSKDICVGAFDEIMLMIGYLMNTIKSDPNYFKDKGGDQSAGK